MYYSLARGNRNLRSPELSGKLRCEGGGGGGGGEKPLFWLDHTATKKRSFLRYCTSKLYRKQCDDVGKEDHGVNCLLYGLRPM